jgi:hypothetical protein
MRRKDLFTGFDFKPDLEFRVIHDLRAKRRVPLAGHRRGDLRERVAASRRSANTFGRGSGPSFGALQRGA